MYVQLGGFENRDFPFTSRQTTPYERSFSIQKDKVVVMGWPIRGITVRPRLATPQAFIHEARLYPNSLDDLRRAAQSFGVLHSWHGSATDVDNDLFFRIGLISNPSPLSPPVKSRLETEVRHFLSSQPPLILEIGLKDVFVAAYVDNTLPRSTTRSVSLADPNLMPATMEAGLL
jgi:hypothetical protein